jgi:hypothetical protein
MTTKPTVVVTPDPPKPTHRYRFEVTFDLTGDTPRERAKSLHALDPVLEELAKLAKQHGGVTHDGPVEVVAVKASRKPRSPRVAAPEPAVPTAEAAE